jgi:hypothetical protein
MSDSHQNSKECEITMDKMKNPHRTAAEKKGKKPRNPDFPSSKPVKSFQTVAEGFFRHGYGLPPLWRLLPLGILFFHEPRDGC